MGGGRGRGADRQTRGCGADRHGVQIDTSINQSMGRAKELKEKHTPVPGSRMAQRRNKRRNGILCRTETVFLCRQPPVGASSLRFRLTLGCQPAPGTSATGQGMQRPHGSSSASCSVQNTILVSRHNALSHRENSRQATCATLAMTCIDVFSLDLLCCNLGGPLRLAAPGYV